ncbi:hypothetical protein GMPD_35920 [Geomonas paludis]|uniref:Uncharacterized protein n=1 Tax=Geomonas paludis TaxID=2740185 RepID=A0A6V8N1N4_9BACT|nr:hypothetical protein GMPD_35920 [Geomonas paludis]
MAEETGEGSGYRDLESRRRIVAAVPAAAEVVRNTMKKFRNTMEKFRNTMKKFQNTMKKFQNTMKWLQN